jgi:hypothetical protein
MAQKGGNLMLEWKIEAGTVTVLDWDKALSAALKLETVKSGTIGHLIKGKAAISIQSEYGIAFYKSAHPGEGVEVPLLIVIDGDTVYATFGGDGKNKVIIGEYSEESHGPWVKKLDKETLWDFCNINARLDGWELYADIMAEAIKRHHHED